MEGKVLIMTTKTVKKGVNASWVEKGGELFVKGAQVLIELAPGVEKDSIVLTFNNK